MRGFVASLIAAVMVLSQAGAARSVDFMQWFNDANNAAIDIGRTTNLNTAAGGGASGDWPEIDEDRLSQLVFTLYELKAMAFADRQRARSLLEGNVVTVLGFAGEPNRWGTWLFLKAPEAGYSARGEWSQPVSQPDEGTPMGLRGRVVRLEASMIHLEEPEILF